MNSEKVKLKSQIYVWVRDGETTVFEKSFDELPLIVGRSLSCDIPLAQYNWISRRHLQVYLESGEVVIADLNSSNGFKFGGKNSGRARLESGATIEVGHLKIVFEFNKKSLFSSDPDDEVTAEIPAHLRQNETVTEATRPSENTPSISLHFVPKKKAAPKSVPRVVKAATAGVLELADEPIPEPPKPRPSALKPVSLSPAPPQNEPAALKPVPLSVPPPPKIGMGALEFIGADRAAANVEKVPRSGRVLETFVTWKKQIYDTKIFRPGESVRIGSTRRSLYIPTLRGTFELVRFDEGQQAICMIPERCEGEFTNHSGDVKKIQDLIQSQLLVRKGKNYILKLSAGDYCTLEMGFDVQVHLRYAPAPRQLSKNVSYEPDGLMQKTAFTSGLVHLLFLLTVFFLAPKHKAVHVKNLPPRFAKLLVEKPKPKPPVKKPEEKKPEPKLAEKPKPKDIPKPQPKPKKVVVQTNTKMKKINKFPFNVKAPAAAPTKVAGPPQKHIEELGALAALGAIGNAKFNPSDKPVAININPNAGGQTGVSTSGMIGLLKAKGGTLSAQGLPGVKTKGRGFGTGTGYGVQGLKGRAGARGVAGAVVGAPTLLKINRTEGLTQKQVMDEVKKHTGKIQQCYERSLLSNPDLAGRIEYEWLISAQGSVEWVKVKRSDMRDSDVLNDCVFAIFKGMSFPVAKNGEKTTPNIGFPFGRQ